MGRRSAEQKKLTLKRIPSPTAPNPTLKKVRLVADSDQKFPPEILPCLKTRAILKTKRLWFELTSEAQAEQEF